jgi:hypothetical protein
MDMAYGGFNVCEERELGKTQEMFISISKDQFTVF